MLVFCCAGGDLDEIAREGLGTGQGPALELRTSLAELREACDEAILVIDLEQVSLPTGIKEGRLSANAVPADAIMNVRPYLPPKPVTAAGGVIARQGREGAEVLLIFRRGAWDLPKGKLDKGESIEACAIREVKEEIGIEDLSIAGELGTTVHGYAEGKAFLVKTTYWYLMQTSEKDFTPQQEEGIEQVAWVPWKEAIERLGYETLRAHLAEQEATVLRLMRNA